MVHVSKEDPYLQRVRKNEFLDNQALPRREHSTH